LFLARPGPAQGPPRPETEASPPRLRYEATASFIRLLEAGGCSLAVSVYLQSRLILISAEGGKLDIQSSAFPRPMGLATATDNNELRLAVATFQEVVVLGDAPLLAASLPEESGRYRRLLVPRAILFSGDIDAHDLVWLKGQLLAANTRFSCIARIDAGFSFTPVWTPPFITQVMPEDRCHLNGIAAANDRIAYVTMLARSDAARGWSDVRKDGGLLMDVASGEAILEGLSMPHSPRLRVDAAARSAVTLAELPGFTRGADCLGDVMFVGLSRIRDRARIPLPIHVKRDQLICGIAAVDRKQGRTLGWLRFDDSYEEVFDVKVLPSFCRGATLGVEDSRHRRALVLPGRAFWGDPVEDGEVRPVAPQP